MKKFRVLLVVLLGFILVSCNGLETLDIDTDEPVLIEVTKVTTASSYPTSREVYYKINDIEEYTQDFDINDYEIYFENRHVYIDNGRPIDWLDYVGEFTIYEYNESYYIIITKDILNI